MWSQQERAWWRHFLGFAAIFKQADPRLEDALTAIQSISDGGSQPDSTSEDYGRVLIQQALTVEASLQNLWVQMQVGSSDGKTKIDAARGMQGLRMEGRRIVNGLSAIISTNPRRDIFSGSTVIGDADAFITPGGENSSTW